MVEYLATPKQWSKIARKFPGRTQHHIKNRFISLMVKEVSCKAEKIRKMIKKNTIKTIINETLQSLNLKANESVKQKTEENMDFSIMNSEVLEKKTAANEESPMKSFSFDTVSDYFSPEPYSFFENIDHFINFD